MMAVSNVDSSSVKFLLRKGADITARDKAGKTAADIAASLGNEEIIGLLRQR
jgi:ankyrin repeat protein